MTDAQANAPLRAFVRGAWLVLTIQFLVALIVFAALSYGAVRLSSILQQTRELSVELQSKRDQVDALNLHIVAVETDLQSKQGQVDTLNARIAAFGAAMPYIRGGIIAFHEGRGAANPASALAKFQSAVASYDQALQKDADNAYVIDLKSYAQYQAGLAARNIDPNVARAYIEAAASTMREGLRLTPRSLNGHIQLAVYLCQLDHFDEAVAVYDAAVVQLNATAVQQEFSRRQDEFVSRCQALRQRFAAPAP